MTVLERRPAAYATRALLPTLTRLAASGRPVSSQTLAETVYADRRTVQRWLLALERDGLVECVATPGRARRGRAVAGWRAAN